MLVYQKNVGRPKLGSLTGEGGPEVDRYFNLYYLDAWSLSHFLMHYDGGKYAASYREFIARGGSLEAFESLIGPVDRIQAEWYPYLAEQHRKAYDAS